MMSLPRVLVLAVLLLAVRLEQARAGSVPGPKVALHVSATTSKAASICSAWSPNAKGIPCSNYVVQGSLSQNLLVYMVVAQVDTLSSGIGGVTAGIEYNGNLGQGVDVSSWILCTDGLEFPNAGPRGDWPAAGGGNSITWITCAGQRIGNDGLHGVVGAFGVYAYSADQLKVTPNRNLELPTLSIANCGGSEVHLDSTFAGGWAGFWTIGRNPCRLTSTGIGDPLPTGYRLYPNSPNPFRDATLVAFDLPEPGQVTLKVFDLSGRLVRILANGDYPAGNHGVSWNARDAAGLPVAQGIYFVSMQSGSFTDTRRLYLQK